MGLFIFWIIFAAILAIGASVLGRLAKKQKALKEKIEAQKGESGTGRRSSYEEEDNKEFLSMPFQGLRLVAIGLAVLVLVIALISTSMVRVPSGKHATFKRIYFGSSMPPGQIVALDGQMGPQARIMTAGWHWEWMVTIINDVEKVPVFTVPPGQCAELSAKDGLANVGGSAFAEPWPDNVRQQMINDANYFLTTGKGMRGPQTTVLVPGSYTINPFLWEEPVLKPATRVEQGTVGVVKSSVRAAVDFGAFKRPMPADNQLKVLTSTKLRENSADVLLVPVGAIGVWEEPLPNGLYYINTLAYKVTMVPTVAQVYEYKGGYKRRTIDISVGNDGQIVEARDEKEVAAQPEMADTAIFTKPEGWDVPQELRVIAQVSPEMAPMVVASLGLTEVNAAQVIEDRVITPIIRSVVRDVLGGTQISFSALKGVLDNTGNPVLDEQGNPKTAMVTEFRSVKVMDLLENRASLEDAIEDRARPEAMSEGVTINEVRLAESAIPAELLIARKREQLAQQLAKAWIQEQLAQVQRKETENARATASQQGELVKSKILEEAAKNRAAARREEGKGEQEYLEAIAKGQQAQAGVLGPQITAQLQMFQQSLLTFQNVVEKNPDVVIAGLTNAHKFVPTVSVSGGSGGLEGAAGILGFLMNPQANGGLAPAPQGQPVPTRTETDRNK